MVRPLGRSPLELRAGSKKVMHNRHPLTTMKRPDQQTILRLLKDEPNKRYNIAGICRHAGVSADIVKNKLLGRYGKLSDEHLDRLWESMQILKTQD